MKYITTNKHPYYKKGIVLIKDAGIYEDESSFCRVAEEVIHLQLRCGWVKKLKEEAL